MRDNPVTNKSWIEEGDIVCVNVNRAQLTISHRAELLHIPVATGDSWIFKCLNNNQTIYVTEGVTIHKSLDD